MCKQSNVANTENSPSVGRNELQSPRSSPRSSPDPAITEILRSRTHDHYDFMDISVAAEDGDEQARISEEETELILFAAPKNSSTALQSTSSNLRW